MEEFQACDVGELVVPGLPVLKTAATIALGVGGGLLLYYGATMLMDRFTGVGPCPVCDVCDAE